MTDQALSLARAEERLLEDEAIRAGLTDNEALPLLDWALAAVRQTAALGLPVDDTLDRVRATGRQLAHVVASRQELGLPERTHHLVALTGGHGFSPGRIGLALRLAAGLPQLDGPTAVRELLALLPAHSEVAR